MDLLCILTTIPRTVAFQDDCYQIVRAAYVSHRNQEYIAGESDHSHGHLPVDMDLTF